MGGDQPTTAFRAAGAQRFFLALATAVIAVAAVLPGAAVGRAQENPLEPLDTSSPRATYLSFVEQAELLEGLLLTYEQDRSAANQAAFAEAVDKVGGLFDFSEVPEATQGETSVVTFARLADILNRIPPPDIDAIPDADEVADADGGTEAVLPGTEVPIELPARGITDYTLPGSEITITLVDEGPNDGSYLFSADTVSRLAEWRDDVEDLPVNEGVRIRDWVQEESDFTGHLVPRSLVDALPDSFDREFLGSPLWKAVVDMLILALVAAVGFLWQRLVGRRGTPGTTRGYLLRLTTPLVVLVSIVGARRFMNEQLNHSGDVATIANLVVTFVIWASLAWGFWILTKLVVEAIIATPSIGDESLDANLLRLLGKVVSVAGAFALSWIGLSRLGVPTVGLGVGAGVAGLAIALAATSTLENLLGGITVYADRPFRVGDNITVDGDYGMVEAIGPRSTRIRRLDDTQVTLPNADISRAKVINFSERHHILFVHVVGVRYETTVEQLRTIVRAIDTRFRAHQMVIDEDDYPRVRVCGFGDSSIDIEVRAHVDTTSFSEFTGVQEDLLLLLYEIIEAAGSGFAFPSSTTYLTEDAGLADPSDAALSEIFAMSRPDAASAPSDRSPQVDVVDGSSSVR
jgi:MscS family membrane protein